MNNKNYFINSFELDTHYTLYFTKHVIIIIQNNHKFLIIKI